MCNECFCISLPGGSGVIVALRKRKVNYMATAKIHITLIGTFSTTQTFTNSLCAGTLWLSMVSKRGVKFELVPANRLVSVLYRLPSDFAVADE